MEMIKLSSWVVLCWNRCSRNIKPRLVISLASRQSWLDSEVFSREKMLTLALDTMANGCTTYFDMKPHLAGRYRENVIKGIDKLCSERFKDCKSKFKTMWFDNLGGYEDSTAIRLDSPPKMELAEWNKYVDYYVNDFNKEISEINTHNCGKQKAPSRHGTKSYAAHREEKRVKNNGQYSCYIDQYKVMHTDPNEMWVNEVAKTRYEVMKKSLAENWRTSTPLSEYEILEKTLGVFHFQELVGGYQVTGH